MPPRSCASAPCTSASPSPPLTYIYLAKRTRKVRDLSAFRKLIRRKLPFWSGDNTEKVPKRTLRTPSLLPCRTRAQYPGQCPQRWPARPAYPHLRGTSRGCTGNRGSKSRSKYLPPQKFRGVFRRRAGGEWKPRSGIWMKLPFSVQALRGLI